MSTDVLVVAALAGFLLALDVILFGALAVYRFLTGASADEIVAEILPER